MSVACGAADPLPRSPSLISLTDHECHPPLSAVVTGETEEGRKLLERGIIISNATLRFMPKRDSAGKEIERIRDSGLLLLAEAVKVRGRGGRD